MDAIQEKFSPIAKKAGVPVIAVVKADAYGHGAVPVAKLLQEHDDLVSEEYICIIDLITSSRSDGRGSQPQRCRQADRKGMGYAKNVVYDAAL